ncbi:SDR family NAD(P)-dependent oxidoreductase [uncultured Allofournierella sp.]|uniref:7alpha-hydroxysteroid dehydrogenase n=1 Tax=uncultured Allofournierella sp. TaxID=1940258 RepID=UPI003752ABB8
MILQNKVAMITSSTRGIGLVCAQALAEQGATVYFAVRRLEAGQQLVDELAQKGLKGGVCLFDADKPETFRTSVEEVIAKEGRIDILVNNYGSTDVKKDFDLLHTSGEDFMNIVNNNLRSVYDTCQAAVASMVKTGGGSIVNIASVGGKYPDMYRIGYGVAKSSIMFLTKNIATQYAHAGIRANTILPGFIATDAAMKNMSPEFLNTFLKTVPLRRPGQPDDIANACVFLASDQSAFITGEDLPVAGGFGMPSPMFSHYGEMSGKG